ncbi:hypothetical protein MFIFM68171_01775 [Madurella fahalii]|uniref:Uncharacterized protein n=1 Tax=Madurella fahalii TaxID=1157608 RepID=A0ABQ0G1X9_9PEZI
MRVTGPTLRRRNHAWLQMRSRERVARRLAQRQEEADDENDADEEAESSDDALDVDSSGDESDDAIDSDDEADENGGIAPPAPGTTSVGAGAGVQIIGTRPTVTPLPAAGVRIIPGNTLSAEDGIEEGVETETDGEESADETSSPSPGAPATATTTRTIESSSQPTLSTTSLPIASSSSSSGLDELVTSLTGTAPVEMSTLSLTPIVSATNGPSLTVPATGAAQTGDLEVIPADSQADQQGEGLGGSPSAQSGVDVGAAAGIVIGVLAFIGLLIGAAFFWRKWRRDRGLPFLPFRGDKLEDKPYSPDIGGPIPGGIGIHDPTKTNTKIMDELMTAAYAAGGDRNDMEGAFLDEKAYAALGGSLTPQTSKPVVEWLDDVKSPTQPNGPEIPPSPSVPPSATLPRPGLPMSSGRIPEPPGPAYYGRDTMTTDTTNTSVRWYG